MATHNAGTGWVHKDHRTQREFERKSRADSQNNARISSLEDTVSGLGGQADTLTVQHNYSDVIGSKVELINFTDPSQDLVFEITSDNANSINTNPKKNIGKQRANITLRENIFVGDLSIDQLPLNPATRPIELSGSEYDYMYNNYQYTPTNGKSGWYVYKTIQHNFKLNDINDFLFHMVDLHTFTTVDDLIEDALYAARFDIQQGIWEVEGLNENTIIVHAVYKPDLHNYYGDIYTQVLDYIDVPNRIIKTNLNYRYIIKPRRR